MTEIITQFIITFFSHRRHKFYNNNNNKKKIIRMSKSMNKISSIINANAFNCRIIVLSLNFAKESQSGCYNTDSEKT